MVSVSNHFTLALYPRNYNFNFINPFGAKEPQGEGTGRQTGIIPDAEGRATHPVVLTILIHSCRLARKIHIPPSLVPQKKPVESRSSSRTSISSSPAHPPLSSGYIFLSTPAKTCSLPPKQRCMINKYSLAPTLFHTAENWFNHFLTQRSYYGSRTLKAVRETSSNAARANES